MYFILHIKIFNAENYIDIYKHTQVRIQLQVLIFNKHTKVRNICKSHSQSSLR